MKNYLYLLFIKCFWTCGLSQHCTDAQKRRMQRYAHAQTETLHISPWQSLPTKYLKGFYILQLQPQVYQKPMNVTDPCSYEKKDTSLHLIWSISHPSWIRHQLASAYIWMCSYQVLNIYPNPTANIILVVNQSSLNVPKFKTSSCCGLTRIQPWAVCLGLHTRLTSTSKDVPGAMQPGSQHHSSPPIN